MTDDPDTQGFLGPREPSAHARAERKVVTVLFADLTASLELIEGLDPEEAHATIKPAIDSMARAVHRYGGYLCRTMGDGIMALFGAPTSQEDHALRACLAAWDICLAIPDLVIPDMERRGARQVLSVRVGLNSGEVVVSDVLTDGAVELDVAGQVAHVASRMQSMATNNSVWLTGATFRLVAHVVKARHLGLRPIRGLSTHLDLYQLIAIGQDLIRFRASISRGLSALVGREQELDLLKQSASRFLDGDGQVVGVAGQAGIGKSRLLFEFVQTIGAADRQTIEIQSLAYDRGRYFVPLYQLLKSLLNLASGDNHERRLEKLDAFCGRFPELDKRLLAPVRAILTEQDMKSGWQSVNHTDRRMIVNSQVVDFVAAISRLIPLIIVWEDVHWIDGDARFTLEALARRASDAPYLLLLSYRDDPLDRFVPIACDATMRLRPLSKAISFQLLDSILGKNESLAALKELAAERAGGNPLFLEEIVRDLSEMGIVEGTSGHLRCVKEPSDLHVPISVSSLIGNRIDRLGSRERETLEAAAAIGPKFQFDILGTIVEQAPDSLLNDIRKLFEAGLVTHVGTKSPLQFEFNHPLYHEVTYGHITKRRRRLLHRRIVDAIEARAGDKLSDTDVQQLAYHSWEGQDWGKATTYLLRAGRLALSNAANRTALHLLMKAEQAADKSPSNEGTETHLFEIDLDIAAAAFALGDTHRYMQSIQKAEQLARTSNDNGQLGWAYSYLALYYWMSGNPPEAEELAKKALEVAKRSGDSDLLVHALLRRGLTSQGRGHYTRSLQFLLEAQEALDKGPLFKRYGLAAPGSVLCKATLARDYAELGDFDRAIEFGRRAVDISNDSGEPFGKVYALRELGIVLLRQGNFAEATNLLDTALQISEETDVGLLFPRLAGAAGYARALSGDTSGGTSMIQQAIEVGEDLKVPVYLSLLHVWLSEIYLSMGLDQKALSEARIAVQKSVSFSEESNYAWALKALGDVYKSLGGDHLPQAVESYTKCQAIAESQKLLPLLERCRVSLADAHKSKGDLEMAERLQTYGPQIDVKAGA